SRSRRRSTPASSTRPAGAWRCRRTESARGSSSSAGRRRRRSRSRSTSTCTVRTGRPRSSGSSGSVRRSSRRGRAGSARSSTSGGRSCAIPRGTASASRERRPMLEIRAGGVEFGARFEEGDAPETVAAFRRLLPLESRIIHVRWSGEAGWIPYGDLDLGLGAENATSYPHPGEILLYPGGVSETEILLAYGYVNF